MMKLFNTYFSLNVLQIKIIKNYYNKASYMHEIFIYDQYIFHLIQRNLTILKFF